MPFIDAPDGTRLAYRRIGGGPPVVVVPGGPMQASSYLDDLVAVTPHVSYAMLDLRGTGDSAVPDDVGSYRCDRQVEDVEALREHLGLERVGLLAHSAGAAVALLHAARHPGHVERLVLVCPSPRVVGLEITDADRREVAEQRRAEPWFADAYAAFERIWAGAASDDDWTAITPFVHGRWDDAARARVARETLLRNETAADEYYTEVPDPAATRAALAGLEVPVVVVAGEHDVALPPRCAAEYAGLFRDATLVVVPGAGHVPWADDPAAFAQALDG
jgi:pimeloyl-ACP methyl ester carboxylesterase